MPKARRDALGMQRRAVLAREHQTGLHIGIVPRPLFCELPPSAKEYRRLQDRLATCAPALRISFARPSRCFLSLGESRAGSSRLSPDRETGRKIGGGVLAFATQTPGWRQASSARVRHGEEPTSADQRPRLPDSVIRAARNGDPQAFTSILKQHDAVLRALAFRILGDRDLMDDALQEASLKAYLAMRTFRGGSSTGTWLYRITYTTCIDHLRRAPHFLPLLEESSAEAGSPSDDPAEVVVRRMELAAALSSLSPEQRVTVLLVLEQGFDLKTAGEVLGIPPGTVASRLSYAREALRACLRPSPPEENS